MPMNSRKLVPTQEPGVLDFAPGAAAAYSLRNLSLSYTGPVVTVRRSTDNAEADFTAAEVSDGTLAAWVGSGNEGFVKTWHDQSQHGRDASNSTAVAQPQIVDSGVLVTEGGKAAVRFDGTDDYLENGDLAVAFSGEDVPMSTFAAFKAADVDMMLCGFGRSTSDTPLIRPWYVDTDGSFRVFNRDNGNASVLHDTGYVGLDFQIVSSASTGKLLSIWQNSATVLASANIDIGAMTLDRFAIATLPRLSEFAFWNGTISELIIYPADMTALRTRIEGNINRHFGVF